MFKVNEYNLYNGEGWDGGYHDFICPFCPYPEQESFPILEKPMYKVSLCRKDGKSRPMETWVCRKHFEELIK